MKAWNSVGFVVIAMSLAAVGCSGAGYESDAGTGAGPESADIAADRVAEVSETSAANPQGTGPAQAAAPGLATAFEKAETNDDDFPAMEDGAYCGPDSDCKSGNCVDGICAPAEESAPFEGFENGAYCGPDSDCKSGKCVDGMCAPAEESAPAFEGFENGAYCGPDSDCKSGKCVDGVCG